MRKTLGRRRLQRLAVVALTMAVAVPGMLLVHTDPAAAAIKCEGGYQLSGGNRISTLYCQEAQLAAVARSYGTRVTAAQIRRSIGKKEQICRFIGFDQRVRSVCHQFLPDNSNLRNN